MAFVTIFIITFFSLLCYRNLEELLMHCMCLSRFDLWDNLQPSDWMSLPCFSMYIFFFPTDRQSNPSLHQVVLPLQTWTTEGRTDGHINTLWFLWDKVSKLIYKRVNTKQTAKRSRVPESKGRACQSGISYPTRDTFI